MKVKVATKARTSWSSLFPFIASLALAAPVACQRAPEIEKRTSSLTSADVLGFESLAAWDTGARAKSFGGQHTQGAHSLAVQAAGYVPITSATLPPPNRIGSAVSVDLLLPTQQPNPYWFGLLQIHFDSPSSGVYNAFVGQAELTGSPTGVFRSVTIQVPPALGAAIKRDASDFRVILALNVPAQATGLYLLDNLRLGPPTVTSCANQPNGTFCNDGNLCVRDGVCQSGVCAGAPVPGCGFDGGSRTATVEWHRPIALKVYSPSCVPMADAVDLAGLTPFAIPSSIAVTGAPAATLALSFARPFLPATTCQYSAGAAGAGQTHDAALVSCDDGSTAGKLVQATSYRLRYLAPNPATTTGDGNCAHSTSAAEVSIGADTLPTLPEPFSPEETRAIRQAFSWADTTPLAELDDHGRPILYYAVIYLENRAHLSFLDDLEIHHDFLPIFGGLGRWRGQVGLFTHHGDGEGVLTYALLTGLQYNQLRSQALAGRQVFSVVNLLTPPVPFGNPDGSVSYDALAQVRFRYRGIDPVAAAAAPPIAPVLCAIDVGGSAKETIQLVAGVTHGTANLVAGIIGFLVGTVTGTNDLLMTVRALNTDPTFRRRRMGAPPMTPYARDQDFEPSPMVQIWGADAGLPVRLTGTKIRSRGVNIPSFDESALNSVGEATLRFNVGIETGICLLLQSNDADVIDFITSVEMCDFSGYSAPPGNIATGMRINIAHDFINVLAQLSDGGHFADKVLGLVPARVNTLVGYYADQFPGQGLTPCFNLPNAGSLVAQPILTLLSAAQALVDPTHAVQLATLGSCIYDVDMVIPSKNGVARSRGMPSHEFGHWVMCNLLFASGSTALTTAYNAAILETLLPPVETGGECNQACGNEGFADFIGSQLTGGTQYFEFNNSIRDIAGYLIDVTAPGGIGGGVSAAYCRASSRNCLENNIGGPGQIVTFPNGTAQQDVRSINHGRLTSIFHDFVDDTLSTPVDAFSSANFWQPSSTSDPLPLILNRSLEGNAFDEPVRLPGAAIRDAIINRRGTSIDRDALYGGLVDAAFARGISWCDVCKVFAVHDSRLSVFNPPDADRYALCAQEPIRRWVGTAPDPGLPGSCNFVAVNGCPPGQIISGVGTCITPPCGGGQVLNFNGSCAAGCDPTFATNGQRVDRVVDGVCISVEP